MKLARVGVIAAAVLAVATVAFAQADFSGTWTLVPAADAPAGGGGGGRGFGGGPMTVTQKGPALAIERMMGDNKVTMTYKLDGTESINKQMMGRSGTEIEVKSTTKWDGNKLVFTHKRPGMDGNIMETTETWSLGADGMLTIETVGGRGPSKRVYKKS
jgi:hypothetical protein